MQKNCTCLSIVDNQYAVHTTGSVDGFYPGKGNGAVAFLFP